MSESNTNATSSPSLSRLSFISTLTMLSPMLGHYLHEYDLYSLCSICCSMPELIEFEVEKMHQRRRIKDEAEREEILHQLSAIEAIRVANGPEIQAIHDAALQQTVAPEESVHSSKSSLVAPDLLTLTTHLVYEKGARLRYDDREMSVRGGNLCDRLRTLSTYIVMSDYDRSFPDISAKYVSDVRLGFTYIRTCLLSNPALWRNRTYVGNGGWHMLNECLVTTMKGHDHWSSYRSEYKVHGEVHVEFEKFTVWLIHLLEVMHVKNGNKTIERDISESPDLRELTSLSHLIFSELEYLVPEKYLTFPRGSEEARRWYQIQWNLLRRAQESCINPSLEHLTNTTHPAYQWAMNDPSSEFESRFYLSTFPSPRLDLTVILCSLSYFQAKFRMALDYAWRHRDDVNGSVKLEEIRKRWMNGFRGYKEGRKKMLLLIQRFDTAVKSGYIEEVRGKLDVWIGKAEEEEQKENGEKKDENSSSASSSASSASSSTATTAASSSAINASTSTSPALSPVSASTSSTSHYYSLLFDSSRGSVLRRCLLLVYFDFIAAKEYKLIRQIHACLHPLFSAELRDPKSGLSPIHYYLTEITSMPAYRLFDELANEAVRYHRGNVTAVLDECSSSGVSIRQLLAKPRHAELLARFTEAHPEEQTRQGSGSG